MKETLIKMLMNYIEGAVKHLNDALTILSNGMISSFSTEAVQIATVIKPTAITILAILFTVEIIDTITKKGEEMRWEDVLRLLIKMLICKNLMEIAPYIMDAMYNSTTSLIASLHPAWDGSTISSTVKAIFEESIPADGTNPIDKVFTMGMQIMVTMGFLIDGLIIHGVALLIKVVVYGRMFELAALQALSPFPIAFAGWAETKDIPKKFLLSYFGLCLQGVAMMVCFLLFSSIIGTPETIWDFLLYTVTLGVGIFSSGKWAKDSLGLI